MDKILKASLAHLKVGSKMPPLIKGKIRIYSMVFCPYAQRPRLVLAAKNINYETVNINLFHKPDWYLSLNPLGQVPCAQFDDGRVVPESEILCEFLEDAFGNQRRLLSTDPYLKAHEKLHVTEFDKIIALFYNALKADKSEEQKVLEKFKKALTQFDSKLKDKTFLGGSQPNYADYMVWPWVERLEAFEKRKNFPIEKSKFPRLVTYIDAMKQDAAVKATYISKEKHLYFINEMLARREPDYDLGL